MLKLLVLFLVPWFAVLVPCSSQSATKCITQWILIFSAMKPNCDFGTWDTVESQFLGFGSATSGVCGASAWSAIFEFFGTIRSIRFTRPSRIRPQFSFCRAHAASPALPSHQSTAPSNSFPAFQTLGQRPSRA